MGICLCEFKAHTAAREVLVWIRAIAALHIEYCHRIRKRITRRMVVANDHIYTLTIGICHFLHGLDTTVKGDNQVTSLFSSVVNSLRGDTIALRIAIGYIVVDIGRLAIGDWRLDTLQKTVHECHCRGTIHIVVAVNEDFLILGNRTV